MPCRTRSTGRRASHFTAKVWPEPDLDPLHQEVGVLVSRKHAQDVGKRQIRGCDSRLQTLGQRTTKPPIYRGVRSVAGAGLEPATSRL